MTKNALANPSFDYSLVSADDKSKLHYFEGQLAKSRERASAEVLKHGELLFEAQGTLSNYHKGVFRAWLESIGMSVGSAYNAIAAYREFGSCSTVEQLEVGALYALATNEVAKKEALKLADKGTVVTQKMAKDLVKKAKEKAAAKVAAKAKPVPADVPFDEPDDAEPVPEPPSDQAFKDLRAKAVKTAEALMRAVDDLQDASPMEAFTEAMAHCKEVWRLVKEWK